MIEWIMQNWRTFLVAFPLGGFITYWITAWQFKRQGSRRSQKNWAKNMELSGDLSLLKLMVKRVNPETLGSEGDAASIYGEELTTYHEETVGKFRIRYKRSSVRTHHAFYQWQSARRHGNNLMTQFVSLPIPFVRLEEKKDSEGKSFWVIVPKEDVIVSRVNILETKTSVDTAE